MTTEKKSKKGGKKGGDKVKKWKCKKHKKGAHDVFINYRVKSDKDLAIKLFYALSAETKEDGKPFRPFLDVECLNDGEEWEAGFLNGLQSAAVILCCVSEDGIKGIENAHQWQDNVLLEFEYALDKHDKGTAVLLPLMVGKNVDGGLYKAFSNFGVSVYSEAKHKSEKSTRGSVRGTMETFFKIQGIKTDPNSLGDRVKDITAKVSEALKKYGRMGEPKTDEKWSDKYASDWTAKDVQSWLKEKGLSEYAEKFKENAVDGTTLLALDEKMISEELGITKKLHQLSLTKSIEQLKAEEEDEEDDEEEADGDGDGDGGDGDES